MRLSFCRLLCMDSSSKIGTYCSFRFAWTSGWSTVCTTCDMSVLTSCQGFKGQTLPFKHACDARLFYCALSNNTTKVATNPFGVTNPKRFGLTVVTFLQNVGRRNIHYLFQNKGTGLFRGGRSGGSVGLKCYCHRGFARHFSIVQSQKNNKAKKTERLLPRTGER